MFITRHFYIHTMLNYKAKYLNTHLIDFLNKEYLPIVTLKDESYNKALV